jgi:hypothetical protein
VRESIYSWNLYYILIEMMKCSSSENPLNNTDRAYLKKLKLNKLAMWNDESKYCATSQNRTMRKLMYRPKGKSK